MTDEIVERIARAISGQDEAGWADLPEDDRAMLYGGNPTWVRNGVTRESYRDDARAALGVMVGECAAIAEESWLPSYVRIADSDWQPGSPYDRGQQDACNRIAARFRALAPNPNP